MANTTLSPQYLDTLVRNATKETAVKIDTLEEQVLTLGTAMWIAKEFMLGSGKELLRGGQNSHGETVAAIALKLAGYNGNRLVAMAAYVWRIAQAHAQQSGANIPGTVPGFDTAVEEWIDMNQGALAGKPGSYSVSHSFIPPKPSKPVSTPIPLPGNVVPNPYASTTRMAFDTWQEIHTLVRMMDYLFNKPKTYEHLKCLYGESPNLQPGARVGKMGEQRFEWELQATTFSNAVSEYQTITWRNPHEFTMSEGWQLPTDSFYVFMSPIRDTQKFEFQRRWFLFGVTANSATYEISGDLNISVDTIILREGTQTVTEEEVANLLGGQKWPVWQAPTIITEETFRPRKPKVKTRRGRG